MNHNYTPVTDKNWKDNYGDLVASASAAAKKVRSGQRVFVGTGSSGKPIPRRALAGEPMPM